MSDLFSIGASGTRAYRAALAAISENISNSSSDGYTRKSVTTSEALSSSSTMALYNARINFGGVQVTGVSRAVDPYLDASVRLSGQALASANARTRWLGEVETALNDNNTGVDQYLSGMFQNIDKLAASPDNVSLRVATLDSIKRTAEAFNRTASDLARVSSGIAADASASVQTVNSALNTLAEINSNLLRTQPGTAAYAQLQDARDSTLHTLSENLNVDIKFGENDAVEITYGGQTLLSGAAVNKLSVEASLEGKLSLSTAGGATLPTPANGTLGGLFSSADVTVARRENLDELARQFIGDMNDWHGQGLTNQGTTGVPLLAGTNALSIMALVNDPAALATRSSDGALNGNLLASTSALRGDGSVQQGWAAMINANASLLSAVKAEHSAAQSRNDQAVTARENLSGIDLDIEAAELLRIQQAYSGCAKILQVAKDTVDAILQIM